MYQLHPTHFLFMEIATGMHPPPPPPPHTHTHTNTHTNIHTCTHTIQHTYECDYLLFLDKIVRYVLYKRGVNYLCIPQNRGFNKCIYPKFLLLNSKYSIQAISWFITSNFYTKIIHGRSITTHHYTSLHITTHHYTSLRNINYRKQGA